MPNRPRLINAISGATPVKNALPHLRVKDLNAEIPARRTPAVLKPLGKKRPIAAEEPFLQSPIRELLGDSRPKSGETLNEMLSSAILAQDKELAGIVHEVDELLKTIRAEDPETRAVSSALQRTVLCAVKQSLLDKELQSLALTDDLTGLYNRRAFVALATQQVKLVRRQGTGLLLFFVDIDRLKEINDTYGHREGDFAIIRAAEALEQSFRDSDIVARLAGDEFAALAIEVSGRDQEIILRRLAKNLRKSSGDDYRCPLSISVGVARLDPSAFMSIGQLMEQADAAMYLEKRRKSQAKEIAPGKIL
jgi:diguanylate cyclase (GGDEF)-like protein